jgi:hypothetical protein
MKGSVTMRAVLNVGSVFRSAGVRPALKLEVGTFLIYGKCVLPASVTAAMLRSIVKNT